MKQSFIKNLFNEFFESEKTAGIVLIFCTIVSLIVANSILGDHYIDFWHRKLNLSFSSVQLHYSIQHWVNDGLMTVFFLLVGLEIEREVYAGELSDIKNATLPIIAAIGGMVVPALIYYTFNYNQQIRSGIGIPMATDIAFALGVLSLVGKKIPVELKIFLTAFAIIDDLGAIIIIALFYSKEISVLFLLSALGIFLLLLIINRLKIHKLSPYLIIGIIMWYFFLKSGIHPTITGILLAFAIPFIKHESNPSYKLQHLLHKPVAYFILPLFAIANTGLVINSDNISSITSVNSVGIIFGLVLGKPLGITVFSLAGIKLKLCNLPLSIRIKHISGAGMLGGIGFTMSIFIANLAFSDNLMIQYSIISILIASCVSGIAGFILLKSL